MLNMAGAKSKGMSLMRVGRWSFDKLTTGRRLFLILVVAVVCRLAEPIVVSLTWYPPYPMPIGTPGSVRYTLPGQTLIVERSGDSFVRVTRYLRSQTGQPDPMEIPTGLPRNLPDTPYNTYVSPVGLTLDATTSPAPDFLKLSEVTPYALTAAYGWPFTSASSFVTGSFWDCGTRTGTLHGALTIFRVEKYFRVKTGAGTMTYLADVPFGSVPTRLNFAGFVGNTVVLAAFVWLIWFLGHSGRAAVRMLRGRCEGCGYSKDGLSHQPCPECGMPRLDRIPSSS